MSGTGWIVARTLELQLALPPAQRQWRLLLFRQRRQQHEEKPTIPMTLDKADSLNAEVKLKGKAINPYLRVGFINLSVTGTVGIMIVASFYLLLLFSGRWRGCLVGLVLVRSEQTRFSMPTNLIWEGNEGVAGSRSLDSDLEVGFENDLIGPNSPTSNNSVIFIHGERTFDDAAESCRRLGESLWNPGTTDVKTLSRYFYVETQSKYPDHEKTYSDTRSSRKKADKTYFWIASKKSYHGQHDMRIIARNGFIENGEPGQKFSAICTNSAPYAMNSTYDSQKRWQVVVESNHELLVGYRDRRSFRFTNVRYAPRPKRWEHSKLHVGENKDVKDVKKNGKVVLAHELPSKCWQKECGKNYEECDEDCLKLNIFTNYLPNQRREKLEKDELRPVMIWVHGGSLLSGWSADPTFDGGNLASRGDIVVVTVNYRLGTLGFLALPDSAGRGSKPHYLEHHLGNYGARDVSTALDWVRLHIHDFGGDKDKITIAGQSAGAALVRALLASEGIEKKFDKAMLMSGLGGKGQLDHFSTYLTPSESYNNSVARWMGRARTEPLRPAGCLDMKDMYANLDCLRNVTLPELVKMSPPAAYLVQDGGFFRKERLDFSVKVTGGRSWHPSLLLGTMRDDAAAMQTWPPTKSSVSVADFLKTQGFKGDPLLLAKLEYFNRSIISVSTPGISGNQSLDMFMEVARLANDLNFRCASQATAWAASHHANLPSAYPFFDSKKVYLYEFNRAYQLVEYPSGKLHELCSPRSGRPSLGEYFKCHSGELYYVFGNLGNLGLPDRDGNDYDFQRYIVDSFTSFIRSGSPNPDIEWLRSRGYTSTLKYIEGSEKWKSAGGPNAHQSQVRILEEGGGHNKGWQRTEQCKALGMPLNVYAQHWSMERREKAEKLGSLYKESVHAKRDLHQRKPAPVPVPTKLADEELPQDEAVLVPPLEGADRDEVMPVESPVIQVSDGQSENTVVDASEGWPIEEDFNATEANELLLLDLSDVDPEVLDNAGFTPEELDDMGYILPDAWQTATSEATSVQYHRSSRWRLVEWIGRWKLIMGVFWGWVFWIWKVRKEALQRQRMERAARGLLSGHQYVGMNR